MQASLLHWAKALSFSLHRSHLSPSILARSTWLRLSSKLTSLILGVTSGWSSTLANSVLRSPMIRLVLMIRFWWSASSICFSLKAWLISSICKAPQLDQLWLNKTSRWCQKSNKSWLNIWNTHFLNLIWKVHLPLFVFGPADPASVCTSAQHPWWQPSENKFKVSYFQCLFCWLSDIGFISIDWYYRPIYSLCPQQAVHPLCL